MQACYGHTEGAAGVTGALLAAGALARRMAPGIVNLRDVNPYVGAAAADWGRGGGGVGGSGRAAVLPRQTAPTPSVLVGSQRIWLRLRGRCSCLCHVVWSVATAAGCRSGHTCASRQPHLFFVPVRRWTRGHTVPCGPHQILPPDHSLPAPGHTQFRLLACFEALVARATERRRGVRSGHELLRHERRQRAPAAAAACYPCNSSSAGCRGTFDIMLE